MGCSMGCSNSSDFDYVSKQEEFLRWNVQFRAMQLSKGDVKKLYDVFFSMDTDGSGSIDVVELLTKIDVSRNKFSERVFSIFDEDKTGGVNFRAFVLSLWNYCTLTKDALAMFAFDLYDQEGKGVLTTSNVLLMLQELYERTDTAPLIKIVINDLHGMERANMPLNIDNFRRFLKTHQVLLFPVFQIQTTMRRNILGVRFWARNANKRLKFSNGKHISVGNFIAFHLNGKKALSIGSTSKPGDFAGATEVNEIMEFVGSKQARQAAARMLPSKDVPVESPSKTAHDLAVQKYDILWPHRAPAAAATLATSAAISHPTARTHTDADTVVGEAEDLVSSLKLSLKPGERALHHAGRKQLRQRRHSLDAQPAARVATPAYSNVSEVELFEPGLFQGYSKAQHKVYPSTKVLCPPPIPAYGKSAVAASKFNCGAGGITTKKSADRVRRGSIGGSNEIVSTGDKQLLGKDAITSKKLCSHAGGKIEHDFMGRRRRQSFA